MVPGPRTLPNQAIFEKSCLIEDMITGVDLQAPFDLGCSGWSLSGWVSITGEEAGFSGHHVDQWGNESCGLLDLGPSGEHPGVVPGSLANGGVTGISTIGPRVPASI